MVFRRVIKTAQKLCWGLSAKIMPTAKNIPDLSGLPVHSHGVALNRFFRGGGPKDPIAYGLWMNFTRLVDVVVREYEFARIELANSRDLSFPRVLVAIGYYESLLTTLKRCINHLKALRRYYATHPSLKNLLPGNVGVLRSNVEGRITGMRDGIQHLEGQLIRGCIQKGEPLCLTPSTDGVVLGNLKISYTEIAKWIRELHTLAGNVASYVEPPESE